MPLLDIGIYFGVFMLGSFCGTMAMAFVVGAARGED
jgi:hypothetical protein